MPKLITIELPDEAVEVFEAFIARRAQIVVDPRTGARTTQREFPEVEDFIEWLVRTRAQELSEQFPAASALARRAELERLRAEERAALAPRIVKG